MDQTAGRLRGCRFASPSLETAYRLHHLRHDATQVVCLVAGLGLTAQAYAYSDYLLFGHGRQFHLLLALRIGLVGFSVAVMAASLRVRDARRLDALSVAWQVVMSAFVLYVNGTRPPGHLLHVGVDVVGLLASYVLLPVRVGPLVGISLAFSAGDVALVLFRSAPLHPLAVVSVTVTYTIANAAGIFAAIRFRLVRRGQYLAWVRERETSAALEQALAEARTLRRLLPICAWCKRISDGQGGWEPVEVYLARHSDTRFTHGMCSDCAAAMERDETAG